MIRIFDVGDTFVDHWRRAVQMNAKHFRGWGREGAVGYTKAYTSQEHDHATQGQVWENRTREQAPAALLTERSSGEIDGPRTCVGSGIISPRGSSFFETSARDANPETVAHIAVRRIARRQHLTVPAETRHKPCGKTQSPSICWWCFCLLREVAQGHSSSRIEARFFCGLSCPRCQRTAVSPD